MPSAKYRFKRSNNISGFQSQNRPSTDTLNALQRWLEGNNERSCEIKTDEDELLIAQLSWKEGDTGAGPDLDASCSQFGVERNFEDS